MNLLSLDQSNSATGYAIFKNGILEKHGVFLSDKKEKNYVIRMEFMYNSIKDVIKKEKIDYVVFEGTQFQNNQAVYSQLSQLQGVIMAIMYEMNIGYQVCSSKDWRKYFDFHGRKRAELKECAINAVSKEFGFIPTEDEAEAILIGQAILIGSEKSN